MTITATNVGPILLSTSSGVQILSSDSNRIESYVSNDSNSQIIYVSHGPNQSSSNNGVRLNPGDTHIVKSTSAIWAILASSSDISSGYAIASSVSDSNYTSPYVVNVSTSRLVYPLQNSISTILTPTDLQNARRITFTNDSDSMIFIGLAQSTTNLNQGLRLLGYGGKITLDSYNGYVSAWSSMPSSFNSLSPVPTCNLCVEIE